MADALIRFVVRVGPLAYLVIFVAATLESAAFLGLVVPGEMLAIFGGALAAIGVLNLPGLLAVVTIGAIIGDSIGYELGRRFGRTWLLKHGSRLGVQPEMLERVDRFIERRGGKAVLLGRFVGILRALVPFVAGSSRMPYPTFLFYNAAGAILWGTAVVFLGYLFGGSWQIAERWIDRFDLVVGVVVGLVLLMVWWRRRRQTR